MDHESYGGVTDPDLPSAGYSTYFFVAAVLEGRGVGLGFEQQSLNLTKQQL